jgi:hypothetical protein
MLGFNEDAYRDRQLNRYLEQGSDQNSSCCNAPFIEGTDTCSECMEDAIAIFDAEEAAYWDKGDQEYERRRDEKG